MKEFLSNISQYFLFVIKSIGQLIKLVDFDNIIILGVIGLFIGLLFLRHKRK